MQTEELFFHNGWQFSEKPIEATVVILFGAKHLLSKENLASVRVMYPRAAIVVSSTAGEIYKSDVFDDTIAGTALLFEKTTHKVCVQNIEDFTACTALGEALGTQLLGHKLKHVFVLSDGQLINGSRLIEGLNEVLDESVIVSGGLAGDAANFEQTVVGLNNDIRTGNVVAIGYYGDHLKVGHASLGGWDEFGAERFVTKSSENILYELDDEPALALYKRYLGDKQKDLPSSALFFPLAMKEEENDDHYVVRTVLSIDDKANSMTFAGNLPEDAVVRFMKANFEKLIDASAHAAAKSVRGIGVADFALYISCVGRKLILGQRISEEIQSAQEVIGAKTPHLGFYSYGEISPLQHEQKCSLHNQTMTITTYKEL